MEKLQSGRYTFINFNHYIRMKNKYIPEDKQYTLKEFKYSGGTDSILYQYLWSPFATYLLRFIPSWVAPNLITFSALLLLFVCHVLFMLPDGEDVVADWKLVMMAISIIIYQHLDNIDGKQARATNSSTPLGMLFDHGSDAISAFLLSGQVLKILGLPYYFRIFSVFGFVMLIYFVAMWSQYCVGYFKLGRVNPVDEGLPVFALIALACTMMDLNFFQKQHIFGTYGEQIIYSLFFLLVPLFFFMSKEIFIKSIKPLSEVLFLPVLYISTGIALLTLYHTYPILKSHHYHCLYYTMLAMWARNMILIQLQFVTKQKYKVFNLGTNCFLFFISGIIILTKLSIAFPKDSYFYFMVIIQTIILFEFCISVLKEGGRILGIRIFSLKPRNKIQ